MVGYIFTDTLEEWQRRLKSAIDMRAKELSVSGPQKDIKIIDELPFEWKSNHMRDTGHSDLAIYHILLKSLLVMMEYESGQLCFRWR